MGRPGRTADRPLASSGGGRSVADDAEWEMPVKGEDQKCYMPFSRVEHNVPWVFFALHFFVFYSVIALDMIKNCFSKCTHSSG